MSSSTNAKCNGRDPDSLVSLEALKHFQIRKSGEFSISTQRQLSLLDPRSTSGEGAQLSEAKLLE